MSVRSLFSLPIGVSNYKELAFEARKLFEDISNFGKNKGGFYTTLKDHVVGVADTAPIKHPEILNKIKEAAVVEGRNFLVGCGYAADTYDIYVVNIWLNEMWEGVEHAEHAHYGSNLSGCFYIEMPENTNGIRFNGFLSRFDKADIEVENYTQYNSNAWELQPEEGDLLVWESYIAHAVPYAKYKGRRRSIAFDLALKRKNSNTNAQ